jgi:hypothetical protein
LALVSATHAADEAKGENIKATVATGYFEKNNSGMKGDASFVNLLTMKEFDGVFQAVPPLMGGKRPVLLPADHFDKNFVAVVIKRGPAITTYTVEKVTRDADGNVYVQYKAETGPAGTAMFASPLIVGVPKEKAKKVIYIENGKTVSTLEVK